MICIANVCFQPTIDAAIVEEQEAAEEGVAIDLDHLRHQISINIDPMDAIEMIIMSVESGIAKNVEEAEHHQISIDTCRIRINPQ